VSLHIALLRGVNVGGHRPVGMADLRGMLADLGFGDGQSLLQSGNLVFRSEKKTGAELEHLLAAETESRLGLRTEFFVRTASEWTDLVTRNPFPEEAARDPAHLVVVFLRESPDPMRVEVLQAAIRGPERARAHGREAYVVYPAGMGRSRLTQDVITTRLAVGTCTARNWNTVSKIRDMLADSTLQG